MTYVIPTLSIECGVEWLAPLPYMHILFKYQNLFIYLFDMLTTQIGQLAHNSNQLYIKRVKPWI